MGCFLWKQLGGDSRHRHTQNIAGPPAAKTAAALGFGFIGIDTSGWVREVEHRFPDFSDLAAFIKTLQSLQANLSPKPRP